MSRFRRAALGASLIAAAAAAFALEVCLGPVRVPLADAWRLATGGGEALPEIHRRILMDVRVPRAAMAAAVGALLGVAGALLQGFLRNPLAEPYLLGVSSGAALAVTVVIALGAPLYVAEIYVLPPAAFAGALVTLAAVYALARGRGRLRITTLILAGVVAGAFLSALVMLVAYLSGGRFYEVMAWLMGHLQPVSRTALGWTAGAAALGVTLAWLQSRDLNALLLGEEAAAALGVDVEQVKRTLFVLSSLLTGAAVAASGLIGFVGLVAPHAVRLLLGPDHRVLIPASAVAGAAILLASDVAARLVAAPAELPVGVVTALLGGPFFLLLLIRHVRAPQEG